MSSSFQLAHLAGRISPEDFGQHDCAPRVIDLGACKVTLATVRVNRAPANASHMTAALPFRTPGNQQPLNLAVLPALAVGAEEGTK